MAKNKKSEISARQVLQYLKAHPGFIEKYDELIEELRLPHDSGSAVSLVERQIKLLRERNAEQRQQLDKLTQIARDNDALFEKTRNLVLEMVAAQNLEQLTNSVQQSLKHDFQADVSTLTLFSGNKSKVDRGNVVPLQEAREAISSILNSSKAVCGTLRPRELSFLFSEQATQVGSAAVAPLVNGEIMGVLAVGSYDPHHYHADMGTVFMNHVCEILNILLPRHME